MYRPMVFTDGNRHARIRRIYNKRRFFGKRYALESSKRIKENELIPRLNDYFPRLIFFTLNNAGKPNFGLDIERYFIQEQGKLTLDVSAMAKSKYYKHLFPGEKPDWDEEKAISRLGKPDVIRYFLDEENTRFLTEFSKIKNRPEHFDEKYIPGIPQKFLKDLGYGNKPVWEGWVFSNVVNPEHKPSNIYEAFCYYARRYYTLLSLALNNASFNCNDPGNYEFELLNEIAEKKLKEHYPQLKEKVPATEEITQALNTEICELTQKGEKLNSKLRIFLEELQCALETKSSVSKYAPTEPDTFIKNFKSHIHNLDRKRRQEIKEKKIDPWGIKPDPFTDSDKQMINDLFAKIVIDESEADSEAELCELEFGGKHKGQGNHKRKVRLLHESTKKPSSRKRYSPHEIDTIKELYDKQDFHLSLDEEFNNDDGGENYTRHEKIEDENIENEDQIIEKLSLRGSFRLLPFFEDGLKIEFSNDESRKSFVDDLHDFVKKNKWYELCPNRNIKMTKYAKNKIWELFCKHDGVPIDDELLKDKFFDSLRIVINNINQKIMEIKKDEERD